MSCPASPFTGTDAFPTATSIVPLTLDAFFTPAPVPTLPLATAPPNSTPLSQTNNLAVGTRAVLCGPVEQLPADGLTGDWRIGGHTVRVGPATRTEAQEGRYDYGWFARVRGTVRGDGSLDAAFIDVKKPDNNDWCEPGFFADWDDRGHDDDDGDRDERAEAKFEGMVEQAPTNGLVGTWVIDGRQVVVTADTKVKIESRAGGLGRDTRLQVKGYWGDDGRLYAREIESKD